MSSIHKDQVTIFRSWFNNHMHGSRVAQLDVLAQTIFLSGKWTSFHHGCFQLFYQRSLYGLYLDNNVLWFMDLSFTKSATTAHKAKVMACGQQCFVRLESGQDLTAQNNIFQRFQNIMLPPMTCCQTHIYSEWNICSTFQELSPFLKCLSQPWEVIIKDFTISLSMLKQPWKWDCTCHGPKWIQNFTSVTTPSIAWHQVCCLWSTVWYRMLSIILYAGYGYIWQPLTCSLDRSDLPHISCNMAQIYADR